MNRLRVRQYSTVHVAGFSRGRLGLWVDVQSWTGDLAVRGRMDRGSGSARLRGWPVAQSRIIRVKEADGQVPSGRY